MFKRLLSAFLAGFLMAANVGVLHAVQDDIWAVHPGGSSHETPVVMVPVAGTSFIPGSDNGISLGSSSYRFSDFRSVLATFSGAVTHSSTLTQTGNLTMGSAARTIYSPATVQSVASDTTTIVPSATFVLIGSTGTITLKGTPTITTSGITTGQYIIVRSTAGAITLQDQATLASSGLALSAATVAITTSTPASFIFDGTVWEQVR